MAFRAAAGYQRPAFRPQCTHLTMTRLYGDDFVCESCHRPGAFGWVYRCTQDRTELIEQAVTRGYTTAFDQLGQSLTEELTVRKGSPAAREDRFSFLNELTTEQMSTYRPEQIATILRQREELQFVIHREKLRKSSAILLQRYRQSVGADGLSPDLGMNDPWVCETEEECQYKVCPFCRPGSADRAYLSLNAVANGELPPTAATGFGFHIIGERPMVDVNLLRNIGLRTAPTPRSEKVYDESSATSEMSMMELLDEQISRGCGIWPRTSYGEDFDMEEASLALLPSNPGQLRHSPKCDNLAVYDDDELPELLSEEEPIQSPWTPPPSPNPNQKEGIDVQPTSGSAVQPNNAAGRSSASLKTNPSARRQLFLTVPSSSALARRQQSGNATASKHDASCLLESAYDVGCTVPFDPEAFELARTTPLARPDIAEELFLQECPTPMMEYERIEGKFTPAPLKVDHGVAVLEESVELGVPDVITQV